MLRLVCGRPLTTNAARLGQRGVERGLVVEIAIAAVEREGRGGEGDQAAARPDLLDLVLLAGDDDGDLVAGIGAGAELALDIGANAPALGTVDDVAIVHELAHPLNDHLV